MICLENIPPQEKIDIVAEFDFGYNQSMTDDFNFENQFNRYQSEQRIKQISNRRFSVANSRLKDYLFIVDKVFSNGFLELPKQNKEAILKDVHFKIKDIASSTGLVNERVIELTEDYIHKVNQIYLFSSSSKFIKLD